MSETRRNNAEPVRPLSPHLQIYRWPVTMLSSILHRVAGATLAGGLLVVTWVLVSAATGPDAWQTVQDIGSSWFGQLALFAWSAVLFYHLSNGIRHLIWDTGRLLRAKDAGGSSYVVFGVAVLLTAALWLVVWCG